MEGNCQGMCFENGWCRSGWLAIYENCINWATHHELWIINQKVLRLQHILNKTVLSASQWRLDRKSSTGSGTSPPEKEWCFCWVELEYIHWRNIDQIPIFQLRICKPEKTQGSTSSTFSILLASYTPFKPLVLLLQVKNLRLVCKHVHRFQIFPKPFWVQRKPQLSPSWCTGTCWMIGAKHSATLRPTSAGPLPLSSKESKLFACFLQGKVMQIRSKDK